MLVEVWYMKPEFFGRGITGVLPDPRYLEATHVKLKTVEVKRGFEEVFKHMQAEYWSPNGEARPLIKSKQLAHTSMSVGDVIISNGVAYVAASIGFKRLGECHAR